MTIKFFTVIVLLATTINVESKFLREKPEFIKSCTLSDKNFNNCFGSFFQSVFREWKDGVPGLKSAGQLDPIKVKRIKFSQDSNPSLILHADMQNVVVRGVSGVIISGAKLNAQKWTIKLKALVPKLIFNSDYKMKGRVIAINIDGSGKSNFVTENLQCELDISLKLRDENGFTFTDIDQLAVTINNIGGFHMHLDNLFNGQKALEETTNALFNDNWREFYEILKPVVVQTIEKVLTDRFKKIFGYVPGNYIITDMPTAKAVYG